MHAAALEGYGSIVVAKLVGISLRQLYYWVNVLHVVHPQVDVHGCRAFRRFTEADVARLRTMKSHVDEGYTVRAAAMLVSGRDA